ncbi:MAG: transposase, partial [Burkholderiales bacterium]
AALEKEIKSINPSLEQLIKEDEKLQANYERIRSVKHVGMVAALQLMVYTHDFTRFDNAKKIASYAGVAPFAYSSGTSIRGKNQVHPMANKTLKKSLHMCALSAIRHAGVMKDYFDRKVAEGKNKMSVINAIRNKILHIIFACVREQRLYTCKQAA